MIEEVLRFWFEENGPEQWWSSDPQFDAAIRSRFGALHDQAVRGELHGWRDTPEGRLAEIIVLDQFSRNLYREDPRAFAADAMALALAQEAVRIGADQAVPPVQRQFFYMPYEHSESPRIHEAAIPLFESLDDPELLDFERRHKAIIDRFGRYPHRNRVLGRPSTPEEIAFLREPGSSF
ncbi:MAG: DUF924 domain-containing protein [Holophagales bacterium]|nr:DUF924 domain-containing protein [Holophagales bacterium]